MTITAPPSPDAPFLVTGATGLIGSHVVARLLADGRRVRAMIRDNSDLRYLRTLPVELVRGDLDDPASLADAVRGAGTVLHCAAFVGDWGPWSLYERAVLRATSNLLGACRAAGSPRFLHTSSINVYGHPRLKPGQRLSEDEPLGQNLWWWDHYCRAKVLTEAKVRDYSGPWTIVRPSWTYGPRDRNTMPRVIRAIKARKVMIVGDGNNPLNIVHADDIADGVVRAATADVSVGRAYNLSSEGQITQRELLDFLTDMFSVPRIKRRVPFSLAFFGGFVSEFFGRMIGQRKPPTLTRYAVALIGRTTAFRIDRARQELGWAPRVHPIDGMRQVLAWYDANPEYKPRE